MGQRRGARPACRTRTRACFPILVAMVTLANWGQLAGGCTSAITASVLSAIACLGGLFTLKHYYRSGGLNDAGDALGCCAGVLFAWFGGLFFVWVFTHPPAGYCNL